MPATGQFRILCIRFFYPKHKDQDVKNYNFVCRSVWVRNRELRTVLRLKWEEGIISNKCKFNRRLEVDRMSKEGVPV
jgi:hypothetical protein